MRNLVAIGVIADIDQGSIYEVRSLAPTVRILHGGDSETNRTLGCLPLFEAWQGREDHLPVPVLSDEGLRREIQEGLNVVEGSVSTLLYKSSQVPANS